MARIARNRVNVRMAANVITSPASVNVRPVLWDRYARKSVRTANTAKNASPNVNVRTVESVIHKRANVIVRPAGPVMCARTVAKTRTAQIVKINASAIMAAIVII